MKKLILGLSLLLALLLGAAGYLRFFAEGETPSPETPTTAPAPMEIVIETTAETEPPVEIRPNPQTLILNGVCLTSWVIEDQVYVTPEDFAAAVGLSLDSVHPVKMSGTDTVDFSESSLTVNALGKETTLPAAVVTVEDAVYIPFSPLVEALGYPEFVDEETGDTYYTPAARRFPIPEGMDVPVIMYHAVSDNVWGIDELFVSPEDMEEQLAYLVEHDFDPIWFEDLAHLEDYDKPVILTFDDGYDDNYLELYPLLQKYQVKATIFIITDCIGNEHKMNADQIRELSDSGLVSIQSHSHTHADMDTLDAEETAWEMAQSKLVLTRLTGKEPYVLCYPTGRYNNHTLELGPEYFQFGLKMVGGQYNTSDDPFLVSRYYMSRYYGIDTFAGYLSSAGDR